MVPVVLDPIHPVLCSLIFPETCPVEYEQTKEYIMNEFRIVRLSSGSTEMSGQLVKLANREASG